MIRRFLLPVAALAAATPAFAADLTPPPVVAIPAVPLFTWTGLYLGGQIGYAWGTDTLTVSPFGFGTNFTPNGVVGGAHIGYNLQLNQFVVGLEGDVEGTGISRNFSPGGVLYDTKIPVQGSIRGRLGVAFDRALLYATGGAEFANFENSVTGFPGFDQNSTTRVGWTIGGGIEYAVTNNWSIRAEYRFSDFGTIRGGLGLPTGGRFFNANRRLQENQVQAGFSYKFDTYVPPPIVAKY